MKINAKKYASVKDMSHHEWLETRSAGIGGSDVAAILGLNKYRTPLSVYMDKVEEIEAVQEENEYMYWGNVLEGVVADEFKKRTGYKVQKSNFMWQHPEHDFMLANVDRFIYSQEEGWGILECKTSSEYRKGEFDGEVIPEEYLLQITHYLAVTGMQYAYLAVLIGGNKFNYFRVDRDDELIEYLIELETKFWNEHVLAQNPPELDGSDASKALLDILFPAVNVKEEEDILNLPQTAESLLDQYDAAKEQEEAAKQIKEEAANKLKQIIGEHQKAVWSDRKISWKSIQSSKFNRKAFEKEHPELAAKYLQSSVTRRFTVS